MHSYQLVLLNYKILFELFLDKNAFFEIHVLRARQSFWDGGIIYQLIHEMLKKKYH